MQVEEFMKDFGSKIKDMKEGLRNLKMEIFILETFSMEDLKEKERKSGLRREKFMMVNGIKV